MGVDHAQGPGRAATVTGVVFPDGKVRITDESREEVDLNCGHRAGKGERAKSDSERAQEAINKIIKIAQIMRKQSL